jgi:hypothetical protein
MQFSVVCLHGGLTIYKSPQPSKENMKVFGTRKKEKKIVFFFFIGVRYLILSSPDPTHLTESGSATLRGRQYFKIILVQILQKGEKQNLIEEYGTGTQITSKQITVLIRNQKTVIY